MNLRQLTTIVGVLQEIWALLRLTSSTIVPWSSSNWLCRTQLWSTYQLLPEVLGLKKCHPIPVRLAFLQTSLTVPQLILWSEILNSQRCWDNSALTWRCYPDTSKIKVQSTSAIRRFLSKILIYHVLQSHCDTFALLPVFICLLLCYCCWVVVYGGGISADSRHIVACDALKFRPVIGS